MWTKLERARHLQWLRVPAPRVLVRTLLLRHVSRCVIALKRSVAKRAALADDTATQREFEMLENFEQSLSTGPRLAVIWPLSLLGALLVAYLLANFAIRKDGSKLLADLTTAALELDRGAAVDAFARAPFEASLYLGAAMIVAWSAMLVVVPLLPAFAVKRRLLAQVAALEERGFATLGARPVRDLEFDLVAGCLLVAPVALLAVALPLMGQDGVFEGDSVLFGWTAGALLVILTIFAGIELRDRYAVRRKAAARKRRRITLVSLLLACALSVGLLVLLVTTAEEGDQPPMTETQIGKRMDLGCPDGPDGPDGPGKSCELGSAVTAATQPRASSSCGLTSTCRLR
jgi:hypothetical protein